ncbi:uncharacterized protein H6S33_010302 [Morchella sextelata]|uniref:uncharacterized protein n=1 Tax=Morchella sextelata TaxID=1174677 RepID=UPI001D043ED3|nr:uncharacterized protein H6S33_010302 [Morchella sextelata]KAH0612250.1 hypothetical protein H6S33_010302 [Morchella sextelata]
MVFNAKRLCLAAAALLVAGTQSAALNKENIEKRALTFNYGGVKVRGVNLGGWLLTEPWITPSIYDSVPGAVDEWTLCQYIGKDACYSKLSNHWNNFITADDFYQIAAAGLNHVRIPIGYWAVRMRDGDPFVSGQLDILDRAIGWARAAGLKVWIDLHGAPGSQNGFDNSGYRDHLEWQTGNNVQLTVEVIRTLSQRYAQGSYNDVVTAIELLNEPLGPNLNMDKIRQYWYDGWGTVRDSSPDVAVVIGDAFYDPNSWNGFMTSGFNNVILDTHTYQVFSPGELSRDINAHVGAACGVGNNIRTTDKWNVIGEWSAARTDCTKYLNGVGRGARWEGNFGGSQYFGACGNRYSGSVAAYSAEEKANTRAYIEAQLDAYEQNAGWFFWTWKTEGAPDWDMRDLLANGLFPQPLTQRYANRCGY